MKSKKIIFLVFGLVILAVPLFIIFKSEDILENGHRHKLRLQGMDPFDPFRGKYLRLRYDNDVTADTELKEGDNAYVTLEQDSLGFSRFAFAHKNKPDHDDYLMAEILWINDGTATIKVDNLSKYFINEDKAKAGEEVLQDWALIGSGAIYAAIRVLDGEARLEDIYVNDTPFLEYLAQDPN